MRHKLLLGALAVAAGLFTACADDNDSNPTLIQPTEFVLNEPAYKNETVRLTDTESLPLSWSQPKYTAENAPVNATYEIQVSFTNSFTATPAEAAADQSGQTVSDYVALDATTTKCSADIQTSDFDKALMKLGGWQEEEVPATLDTYIRVYAYIAEGSTRLNPIASNVVKLSVNPYYVAELDPIMWYILGNNFGDGTWSTSNAAIGSSSYPLFIQSGYAYDKYTGQGEIVYLNYFNTDGFKINPSTLTDWDHGFMGNGANGAVYRDGGSDAGNIWCDPAGYYLVTVNTADNTCTIVKQEITPEVFADGICISGSFNGWGDTPMSSVNKSGENHVWCHELTVAEGETVEFKFKIPGSWDTNWGGNTVGNGLTYFCGVGTNNGSNISLPEGTWIIMFNDIDGSFSIIPKQQ